MNGLLGVFKLIKAGKEKNPDCRKFLFQSSGKFQSIHVGHLDIRHHDIRLIFLSHLQCLHAVRCTPYNMKAKGLPVDLLQNHLCYFFFIVHQKDTVLFHCFPHPRSSLDAAVAVFLPQAPSYGNSLYIYRLYTDFRIQREGRSTASSLSFRIFYRNCPFPPRDGQLLLLNVLQAVKRNCSQDDDTFENELKVGINSENGQGIGQ